MCINTIEEFVKTHFTYSNKKDLLNKTEAIENFVKLHIEEIRKKL